VQARLNARELCEGARVDAQGARLDMNTFVVSKCCLSCSAGSG